MKEEDEFLEKAEEYIADRMTEAVEMEIIDQDGELVQDLKKEKHIPLMTLEDVRVAMAKQIRAGIRGKTDPSKSTKIVYQLNMLKGVITELDLQKRVDAIERTLNQLSEKKKLR